MEVHSPAPKADILRLKSELTSMSITKPVPIYKKNYITVRRRVSVYRHKNIEQNGIYIKIVHKNIWELKYCFHFVVLEANVCIENEKTH